VEEQRKSVLVLVESLQIWYALLPEMDARLAAVFLDLDLEAQIL